MKQSLFRVQVQNGALCESYLRRSKKYVPSFDERKPWRDPTMTWLSVVQPYTDYPGGRFFFTYEGYKVFERRTLLWRKYNGNVRVFSTTDCQLYELMGHYGGISLYYQDRYQVNYSAKTRIGLKVLCRFLGER